MRHDELEMRHRVGHDALAYMLFSREAQHGLPDPRAKRRSFIAHLGR